MSPPTTPAPATANMAGRTVLPLLEPTTARDGEAAPDPALTLDVAVALHPVGQDVIVVVLRTRVWVTDPDVTVEKTRPLVS